MILPFRDIHGLERIQLFLKYTLPCTIMSLEGQLEKARSYLWYPQQPSRIPSTWQGLNKWYKGYETVPWATPLFPQQPHITKGWAGLRLVSQMGK